MEKKIVFLVIVLTICCLTLNNALTGHGIIGNKNLNSEVLASGSGSNGSGSNSSGTGDGYTAETKLISSTYTGEYTKGDEICEKITRKYDLKCIKGGPLTTCTPGTITENIEHCFKADK